MGRARFAMLAGAALLAAAAAVHAQNAYTTDVADLRAGPDESYPLVAVIDAGAPVDVMGCLDDWSWCDVVFDDTRGWMYAPSLAYVYEGARVPFYAYAPTFGLPIITFSLGTYWNRYYRGRPWYGQRREWERRHIPHRRPPGPPPRRGRPPLLAPGRGPRPSEGFRQRGGGAIPERRGPQVAPSAPRAPEHFRQPPANRTGAEPPGRAPRAGGAPPNAGRPITPHREGPSPRGAPPARGEHAAPRGEHAAPSDRAPPRGGAERPHPQ